MRLHISKKGVDDIAERRMFSKTIVDSDAFLDMPLSAQALYFHLNMRADDEGFVNNPKKIQRTINASADDLSLLILRRFIIPFESGIVVIKHWRIHNYIAKDRFKPTVYKDERSQLHLKTNNAYTLNADDSPYTKCIQDVYKTETQVRLGKYRLDEEYKNFNNSDNSNTKNNTNNNLNNQYLVSFEKFWSIYPKKSSRKAAEKEWEALEVNEDLFKRMVEALAWQIKTENWTKDNGKYIPYPSTWLNDRRWEDEPPAEVAEASRPGVDRSCVNPKGRIVVDENGYERFVREEEDDGIQT